MLEIRFQEAIVTLPLYRYCIKYFGWKYDGDIEGYFFEEQLDGTISLCEYYYNEVFDYYVC